MPAAATSASSGSHDLLGHAIRFALQRIGGSTDLQLHLHELLECVIADRALHPLDRLHRAFRGLAVRRAVIGRFLRCGGDITLFKDRWKWIETDMFPKFKAMAVADLRRLLAMPVSTLAKRKF